MRQNKYKALGEAFQKILLIWVTLQTIDNMMIVMIDSIIILNKYILIIHLKILIDANLRSEFIKWAILRGVGRWWWRHGGEWSLLRRNVNNVVWIKAGMLNVESNNILIKFNNIYRMLLKRSFLLRSTARVQIYMKSIITFSSKLWTYQQVIYRVTARLLTLKT